jgi:mRNA interferase MazF
MVSQPSPLRRGQVVWVDLDPARGSEASGRRPALVVSSDENNKFMPTITIAPLTSSVKKLYPFEVFIEGLEIGLAKDSKVQVQQIRTLSRERVVEAVGTAGATTMLLVNEAIKLHLGL